MSSLRRFLPLVTLAVAIAALYLYNLDGTGVLLKDEPRYAAIGRAMGQSGDWLTPRLWGSAWFEKPPLVYWMTALGTVAGLDPELSARLPVALLSLLFLGCTVWLLRDEFGWGAAVVAAALLASCAGWITYSQLCLTDLPLAVCFSLAVFLALPLLRPKPCLQDLRWRFIGMGAFLGLAMLAKGLVPLVLALPFFWFLRRYVRNWWIAMAACAVVASPWYLAMYGKNGYPFFEDFFLKHHLERFYSASLQHVQPWYFYLPVLLAGVFPWTPLVGILAVRPTNWDERRTFLAVICGFGMVFFSLSLNKLPGYLLPLLPSLFVLVAAQFAARTEAGTPIVFSRAWLLPCALLIATIPLLVNVLPEVLGVGRISLVAIGGVTRTEWFYVAVPVAAVFLGRRSWAGVLLVLCIVASGIYLKARMYPVLDRQVSGRQLWKEVKPLSGEMCEDWAKLDLVYSLSFYRGSLVPACVDTNLPYHLRSHGRGAPTVERVQ